MWKTFWKSNAKTNFLQLLSCLSKFSILKSVLKNQNISTSYIACILLILFAGLDRNLFPPVTFQTYFRPFLSIICVKKKIVLLLLHMQW